MSESELQQLAYHPVAAKDKTVEVRLWKGVPGRHTVYSRRRSKVKSVKIYDNAAVEQLGDTEEYVISTGAYLASEFM